VSIDAFLLGGNDEVDSIFGTVQMVCNGQTFPVVMGESRKSYEGALGGLESSVQLVVTAQPRHVSNVGAMLQKRCTVDGVEYRVEEVSPQNTVALHFTLADPSESR
jgi:hypothetical protein